MRIYLNILWLYLLVRHYQRLNRLEEQMTVLDYLFGESRSNQLIEWTKSMEDVIQQSPDNLR